MKNGGVGVDSGDESDFETLNNVAVEEFSSFTGSVTHRL